MNSEGLGLFFDFTEWSFRDRSIQTVYSGRELFAFDANVGGDDEEAEDIVIEREQVNFQSALNSIFHLVS